MVTPFYNLSIKLFPAKMKQFLKPCRWCWRHVDFRIIFAQLMSAWCVETDKISIWAWVTSDLRVDTQWLMFHGMGIRDCVLCLFCSWLELRITHSCEYVHSLPIVGHIHNSIEFPISYYPFAELNELFSTPLFFLCVILYSLPSICYLCNMNVALPK